MRKSQNQDRDEIEDEIDELENKVTTKKQRLMPKKADHRMRAHINPLSDTPFPYPLNVDWVNWKLHFPKLFEGTTEENVQLFLNTNEYPLTYEYQVDDKYNGKSGVQVDFADVGCGFGGLLFGLSESFPDKISFGMEIRDKVTNFVGEKIRALRTENPDKYNNISVIRTNAMRHTTNYFRKGQLSKMFFCFPDPHFKKKNFRKRIINQCFLSEYAYIMKPKGRIYCITDVEYLHEWHVEHLNAHSMFKPISTEELKNDICIDLIYNCTEEGQKVARNNGKKYVCVYQRIEK